jgi:UDP:flavonoid glycosyltransferase YjiC (YdhE family)
MTVGPAGDSDALGTVPPNAHVEGWWPQEEVLPHAALVVGHGGFGTTLGALAAGVPQVNVPLFALDQFENATRAAEIGLGAVVPNRADLIETAGAMTAPNPALLGELRTAVNQALNDQSIALQARRVAGDMADLHTCVECSAVVEEMLESKGPSQ